MMEFSENHPDLARGEPLPITIGGETYKLQPLRMKDFAALRSRMRAQQVQELMRDRSIDPITKRHTLSMQKPATLEQLVDEMMFPSTALWVVTNQLKVHHPEVTEDWVERHCSVMDLIQIVTDISGLSGVTADQDQPHDTEGAGAAKNGQAPTEPPRLRRGSSNSAETTTSPTGGN